MMILAGSVSFADHSVTKELAEIRRCVENLLQTPVETCGMYRDFGVSWDALDMPTETAKAMYSAQVIEKIEKYEPRVRVTDVTWTVNANEGTLRPKVVLELA